VSLNVLGPQYVALEPLPPAALVLSFNCWLCILAALVLHKRSTIESFLPNALPAEAFDDALEAPRSLED
jgi:hypothetical protein